MRTLRISISNVIVSLPLFKEVYITHLTRSSKQLQEPQKRRAVSTGNLSQLPLKKRSRRWNRGQHKCLVDTGEQFPGGRDLPPGCDSPPSKAFFQRQKEVTCWHPGLHFQEGLFFAQAKQTTVELRASPCGRALASHAEVIGFDSW